MKESVEENGATSHLRTRVSLLDEWMKGGLSASSVTEVVGPAGCGKTQLCMSLSAEVTCPELHGGIEGTVMYFDSERSFDPTR